MFHRHGIDNINKLQLITKKRTAFNPKKKKKLKNMSKKTPASSLELGANKQGVTLENLTDTHILYLLQAWL